MYIRIGDEKILVKHCIFGKKNECVEINKRFLIDNAECYDSEEKLEYENINIHGKDYNCKTDFEKILKKFEDM